MKTIIEWKTGTPDEYGEYLTLRKSVRNVSTRVDVNTYATDELMKNGPLPAGWRQGWQVYSADGCRIVAWAKIKDIQSEEFEIMTIQEKKWIEEHIIIPGKESIKKFGGRDTNGYIELALEAYEKAFGKINWYE